MVFYAIHCFEAVEDKYAKLPDIAEREVEFAVYKIAGCRNLNRISSVSGY